MYKHNNIKVCFFVTEKLVFRCYISCFFLLFTNHFLIVSRQLNRKMIKRKC